MLLVVLDVSCVPLANTPTRLLPPPLVLLVQLESTICRTARSLVLLAWLESIVFLELVVAVVAVLENIPQLGRTSAPLALLVTTLACLLLHVRPVQQVLTMRTLSRTDVRLVLLVDIIVPLAKRRVLRVLLANIMRSSNDLIVCPVLLVSSLPRERLVASPVVLENTLVSLIRVV